MPTIKKFTGLNNVETPVRAREGDLQVATGLYVTNGGALKRRRGFASLRSGVARSLFSVGTNLYFVSSGTLYRYNGSTFTALDATIGAGAANLWYARVAKKIFYSNGTASGIILASGTKVPWGLAPPPSFTAVALGAGSLPAGAYKVALTYVLNDGQESGATLCPVDVQVSNGAIALSGISASTDPRVVGIGVYVSSNDGQTLHDGRGLLLQAQISNASAPYSINSLGAERPCVTMGLERMPAGTNTFFYRGRLYTVVGDTIYYSEPWSYELCNLETNRLPLADTIRFALPVENGIWVGTEREHLFLAGSDPQDGGGFTIRSRTALTCLEGGAVVGSDLMNQRSLAKSNLAVWVTSRGVFVGDANGQSVALTENYWVPGTTTGGHAAAVVPVADEQLYVFLLGTEAYAMNLMNGAVTHLHGGLNSIAEYGGYLVGGGASNLRIYNAAADPGLTPVAASFEKQGMEFDSRNIKRLTDLFFLMKSTGNFTVTVSSELGSGSVTLVDGIDTMHGSKADLPRGVSGRVLALAVSNLLGADFEIAEVDMVAEVSTTRRGRQVVA